MNQKSRILDVVLIIAILAAAIWFQGQRQQIVDQCRQKYIEVLDENCENAISLCGGYQTWKINKDRNKTGYIIGEEKLWNPTNKEET